MRAGHIGKFRLEWHDTATKIALVIVEVFTRTTNRHTLLSYFYRGEGGIFSHALCSVSSTGEETFTATFVLIFGHKALKKGAEAPL